MVEFSFQCKCGLKSTLTDMNYCSNCGKRREGDLLPVVEGKCDDRSHLTELLVGICFTMHRKRGKWFCKFCGEQLVGKPKKPRVTSKHNS